MDGTTGSLHGSKNRVEQFGTQLFFSSRTQIVKESRLKRLQRPLLLTEEIRLRLSRALPLERVTIDRAVVG